MRALFVGDIHWNEVTSILRKFGESGKTLRLENLKDSVNWVERLAEEKGCSSINYGGDFFDKSNISALEVTTLQEIEWASNIPHTFLVGNHEGLMNDLSTSSAHLFNMIPNSQVIDKPTLDSGFGYRLLYLPYILESDRKPIGDYISSLLKAEGNIFETQELKIPYVFSHNDIKMFYGKFESKEGFEISDIENSCCYFLNAHLHNGSQFCKNGYNIGNLTGQNFSEDGFKYLHQVCILDTDTQKLEWIENPYAYYFYKLEINSLEDLNLNVLKDNSVITVRAPENIVDEVREILTQNSNKIKEFRVITMVNRDSQNNQEGEDLALETVNHLDEFIKFVNENLEVTDLVLSELSEVCK